MKIVMLSDTHMQHEQVELPKGDMIIHCGDFSSLGYASEYGHFAEWFEGLDFEHKILVAGNHDKFAEYHKKAIKMCLKDTIYLENESVIIEDLKFWGSPVTPPYNDWAFNWDNDMRKELFEKIPIDVDVLITHGAPFMMLDTDISGSNFGCVHLRNAVERINPILHCFGHIHEAYGRCMCFMEDRQNTTFVNCSVLNGEYKLINKPIVYEIKGGR